MENDDALQIQKAVKASKNLEDAIKKLSKTFEDTVIKSITNLKRTVDEI
ncbi:MAG: hypothetical protein LUD77_06710 [Clostridiales bacterium]|nr:hypothetical protein [Clostridiales bacterium]